MPKRYVLKHSYMKLGDGVPFDPFDQNAFHIESEPEGENLHVWWIATERDDDDA